MTRTTSPGSSTRARGDGGAGAGQRVRQGGSGRHACRVGARGLEERRKTMTVIDTLQQRNATYATTRFVPLPLRSTLQTTIVGCVDPRVDPAHILGLELGEAGVIRNVGGRITPATLQMLALLRRLPRPEGAGSAPGNLVILQHTD